jgi:hypothetical protein
MVLMIQTVIPVLSNVNLVPVLLTIVTNVTVTDKTHMFVNVQVVT